MPISMLETYTSILKNKYNTNPEFKQDAYRTRIKAYRPIGHLIEKRPFSLRNMVQDDIQSIKYFAKGIQGKGNDYSIGRINDATIKLGSLGIAAMIATGKGSPLRKGMEFVGLASWLAAMSLWPKLAVNAPIKKLKGVDLDTEYVTAKGHKKKFYQDPQFMCWDMFSDKEINAMGDKLGVPQNIKNRRKAIENKARQVSVQANTLALLTAGFATPLAASLVADQAGKRIISPMISTLQESKAEAMQNKMLSESNQLLKDAQAEKLINTIVSENMTNADKKKLISVFNKLSSDITLRDTIKDTVNNILDGKNIKENTIQLSDSINQQIADLFAQKRKPKVNITDILKKTAAKFNNQLTEKTLPAYIEKLKLELIRNHAMTVENVQNILPEAQKILSASKAVKMTSVEQTKQQLINMSRMLTTHNYKVFNDFEKHFYSYIWSGDTSLNAKIWDKMVKSTLSALGIDGKTLKKLANSPSEASAQYILSEFIDKVVQNSDKYNKALQKLGKTAAKLSMQNDKYINFSLAYIDNMQKLLSTNQNGELAELSRQMTNSLAMLRKQVLGKFISTNNTLFAPIRILSILKANKDIPEYKELKSLLFNNMTVDSFINRLDNFKKIIKDENDYKKFTGMMFSPLSSEAKSTLPNGLSAKIDATADLMKYLLKTQSDGVNIKYAEKDINAIVKALKRFGFYKYADEIFDVTFNNPKGIFDQMMAVINTNPKKAEELKSFLHLSENDLASIKSGNFDSMWRDTMGSPTSGKGFLESGRHRFKTLMEFFGIKDFSSLGDFRVNKSRIGKVSAMQGSTFKNFIKDNAKEAVLYGGWVKKVGLAFVGLCAITAYGISQIGKKNEFNLDIYEERSVK